MSGHVVSDRKPGYNHPGRRALLPRNSLLSGAAALAQGQSASTPCEKTWELDNKTFRGTQSSTISRGQKRRREQVSSACDRCQKRRIKCDGFRPSCQSCTSRNVECSYSVPAGISRNQNLKTQVQELSKHVDVLELFVDILAQGTDFEASAALSRLRVGHSVPEVIGSMSSDPDTPTSAASTIGMAEQVGGVSSYTTNTVDHQKETDGTLSDGTEAKGITEAPERGNIDSFLIPLFDRTQWLGQKRRKSSVATSTVLTSIHPEPSSATSSPSMTSEEVLEFKNPFGIGSADSGRTGLASDPSTLASSANITSHLRLSGYTSDHLPLPQFHNSVEIPIWAVMPANLVTGVPWDTTPVTELRQQVKQLISSGSSLDEVIGGHPNMAAMLNVDDFVGAQLLSKWAARFVRSLKHKDVHFTAFALMYLVWYLARWLIDPRTETYEDIPIWLRPTPNQLFIPHSELFDFLIWPTLRDHAVTNHELHFNLAWLMEMSLTLTCAWNGTPQEVLDRDPITGDAHLTDIAKDYVKNLANWSLPPPFRKHLLNADAFVKIKQDSFRHRDQ
ncbi:hypothetical protein NA57DRAFT_70521 [Rhizodiscina lignyota]|uniref:Zn(2)-C6 fungal-type domain-containing protein n=1 Tax=Rhizodiscina lignyota TaxID=1504668 RepID=A0A9P4INE1_9PEZI|nr:hypothetical protein NA57DRAFT_70521 [Rhizodiscina lignyota]